MDPAICTPLIVLLESNFITLVCRISTHVHTVSALGPCSLYSTKFLSELLIPLHPHRTMHELIDAQTARVVCVQKLEEVPRISSADAQHSKIILHRLIVQTFLIFVLASAD